MEQSKYRGAGGIVYWKLGGDSQVEPLASGNTLAGLDAKLLPEPRTPLNALRATLEALSDDDVLIRPLAGKDGYTQVRESVGDDGNAYDGLSTIKVMEESLVLVAGDCDLDAVRTGYTQRLTTYSKDSVSGYLGRVVQALGGTSLRPQGCLYWIPERALEQFRHAGEGVERAGENSVYLLTLEHDAELVRSVGDAIVTEITQAADDMDEELSSKELGERAIKHRIETAKALTLKVREYEQALQCSLQPLADRLVRIETACAILNLQASNANAE